MKPIVFLLLCFISLFANAQRINVGADYLFLRDAYDDGDAIYKSKGGLFVEKGFELKSLKQIIIRPGISFKTIHEDFFSGGNAAGFSRDLNHYSVSAYCKIIRTIEIAKIKPILFHVGALGGATITSWARGKASNYSMFDHEANWSDPHYKENPSQLFRKMYYGFLAGMTFRNNSSIEPALELRFMPGYGQYSQNVLNPLELAVSIGFGKKAK